VNRQRDVYLSGFGGYMQRASHKRQQWETKKRQSMNIDAVRVEMIGLRFEPLAITTRMGWANYARCWQQTSFLCWSKRASLCPRANSLYPAGSLTVVRR
jgi:hypothetical protein